jgi:hypothetical protein
VGRTGGGSIGGATQLAAAGAAAMAASHSATAAPVAAQLLALARILVSTTCAPVHAEAQALLTLKLVRSGLFHGNPAEAAVWVRLANNPAVLPWSGLRLPSYALWHNKEHN